MPTDQASAPAPPGWRLRIGISLFVLGWVCPLFIPLVTASDLSTGWKTTLSGLLLVGAPEVFGFAAIFLLGKPGFNFIKSKVMVFLKRYGAPREVSRARYRFGLTILILVNIFGVFIYYAPDLIPGYSENRLALNLMAELLFVASFFILGGDFWDKFRALFIYEAKAQIPERKSFESAGAAA